MPPKKNTKKVTKKTTKKITTKKTTTNKTTSVFGANINGCKIPEIYCGAQNPMPYSGDAYSYYTRVGTGPECLKKGIGAGIYLEKKKNLSPVSVQNIKYVGDKFEKNFTDKGINTLNQLVNYIAGKSEAQIKKFLDEVCLQSNGVINKKAYNAIIIYLSMNGHYNLPKCHSLNTQN